MRMQLNVIELLTVIAENDIVRRLMNSHLQPLLMFNIKHRNLILSIAGIIFRHSDKSIVFTEGVTPQRIIGFSLAAGDRINHGFPDGFAILFTHNLRKISLSRILRFIQIIMLTYRLSIIVLYLTRLHLLINLGFQLFPLRGDLFSIGIFLAQIIEHTFILTGIITQPGVIILTCIAVVFRDLRNLIRNRCLWQILGNSALCR
ncbi:hypothetical protein D3C76_1163620 [compost metagenome]